MQPPKQANETAKGTGRWTEEEHQRFMVGIMTHGKDWKKVEEVVGTRTGSQVRSHAQKFFNKINKMDKDKTKPQKKEESSLPQTDLLSVPMNHLEEAQASESFNQLLKGYTNDEASNSTPFQLVSLIRNHTHENNKTNLNNLKKELVQKIQVIEEQAEDKQLDPPQLMSRNSYKSMNNIISAYENVKDTQKTVPEKTELQDQSFLILLTKKYKKYFSKGGTFENLIDFGKPENVEQFQKSIRKRSFTLPEGIEGDEDDLQQRKKRVFTEVKTGQMTEKELSSFQEAMRSKKEGREQPVKGEGQKNIDNGNREE